MRLKMLMDGWVQEGGHSAWMAARALTWMLEWDVWMSSRMRQMQSGIHMLRHHACVQPRSRRCLCDMVGIGDVHYRSRAATRTFIFARLHAHDVPVWLLLSSQLPACLCGASETKLPARYSSQPKCRLPFLVLVLGLKRDLGRGYAIATLFHTANQPRPPRPHCACLPACLLYSSPTRSLTHSLTPSHSSSSTRDSHRLCYC